MSSGKRSPFAPPKSSRSFSQSQLSDLPSNLPPSIVQSPFGCALMAQHSPTSPSGMS